MRKKEKRKPVRVKKMFTHKRPYCLMNTALLAIRAIRPMRENSNLSIPIGLES